MPPPPQTRKRSIASCSECYVRKQKCDRKYPCCHCRRRRRPEICSYATSDAIVDPTPTTPENPGKRARDSASVSENAEDSRAAESHGHKSIRWDSGSETIASQGTSPVQNPSLTPDGSMDDNSISSHLGYADYSQDNLAGLMKHFGLLDSNNLSSVSFQHVQPEYCKIMKENLPGRVIIDTLVQIFFQEANWMYEAIYPPTFLEQYQEWWKSSPGTQVEDMIFATLLLRICAYATQFLPSTTYTAATICCEPLSDIRSKCYDLATTLTNLLKSICARPTLSYVLQLFYAACYAKNEGNVKNAWDLLGQAIQLAVDLGMHEERQQVDGIVLTDFEAEMRRRAFWNLYIWDRFMSTVLDRWPRIPEDRCKVSYPTMQLSTDPTLLNGPDLFLERMLQIRFARVWFSDDWPSYGQSKGYYDKHLIEAKHMQLQKEFVLSLPPVFMLENADEQWDNLVPSLKKKREILHLTIYALLSNLHRLVLRLTRKEIQDLSVNERKLTYQHRIRFVDYTLKLLSSVFSLHDLLGGSQNRLFILSFYIFEAGIQLGMYLLELRPVEDLYTRYHTSITSPKFATSDGNLGQSSDPWKKLACLQAMDEALQRLHILGEVSSIAKLGARKLAEMIAKVKPHCPGEAFSSSAIYSENSNTRRLENSIAHTSTESSHNYQKNPGQMSISELQGFMAPRWPIATLSQELSLAGNLSYPRNNQFHDSSSFSTTTGPSPQAPPPLLLAPNTEYPEPFSDFGDFIAGMPNSAMDSEDYSDLFSSILLPLSEDQPDFATYHANEMAEQL